MKKDKKLDYSGRESDFVGLFKRINVISSVLCALFAIVCCKITGDTSAGMYFGIAAYLICSAAYICGGWIFYFSTPYSEHDKSIIGHCFSGFDRASLLFRRGMRCLADNSLADSLRMLLGVDEYRLNTKEKAVLCFYTAVCYRNMGYPTNAAAYFIKAGENGLDIPDVRFNALRCYCRAGSIHDAENIFAEMCADDLDKVYFNCLYTEMGMMFVRADDPDNAVKYFEKSIELEMDKASATGGLAVASLLKGDLDSAMRYFRKALIANIPDRRGFIEFFRTTARDCGFEPDLESLGTYPEGRDKSIS